MSEPIEIRAHHIGTAKALYLLPNFSDDFLGVHYLENDVIIRGHPFSKIIEEFKKLFENPKQEFKIKIGGLDFICEACPRFQKKICDPNDPSSENPGRILDKISHMSGDIYVAKKYNLQEGCIYTAEELRERAGF